MYRYKTRGTCSQEILFDIEDDLIKEVQFVKGCMGNTAGVARLCENRPVDEVIALLEGIDCGGRGTSCPDQLAQALKLYRQKSSDSNAAEEPEQDPNAAEEPEQDPNAAEEPEQDAGKEGIPKQDAEDTTNYNM